MIEVDLGEWWCSTLGRCRKWFADRYGSLVGIIIVVITVVVIVIAVPYARDIPNRFIPVLDGRVVFSRRDDQIEFRVIDDPLSVTKRFRSQISLYDQWSTLGRGFEEVRTVLDLPYVRTLRV